MFFCKLFHFFFKLSYEVYLFVVQIKLALNTYSISYKNFLVKGNFNITIENSKLQDLMDVFCLENLIKTNLFQIYSRNRNRLNCHLSNVIIKHKNN